MKTFHISLHKADLVDKQFDRAINIERSELLKENVKPDKKVFPLVLDYNPILPDIQKVIQRHVHLLTLSCPRGSPLTSKIVWR